MNIPTSNEYETRVRKLEAEGMTRSDAQAVADAQDESEAPTHHFVSCAFGFAIGQDRDECIERLVSRFRSDVKRCVTAAHKNGEAGFYMWSCLVHAPESEQYKIEWFAPKDIEISAAKEHAVTYVTAKKIAHGPWGGAAK